MTVQPVAFTERGVMYRERASGMYHELPFALAQCFIELPYNLIQTLLFGAISYYMMGFAGTAAKFFWWVFLSLPRLGSCLPAFVLLFVMIQLNVSR